MLKKIIILTLALTIGSCTNLNTADQIYYYHVQTQKPYNDVLAELEIAISEHNFRITGHSRVGKVIRKRENINFPEYDTLQFCNLTHAKKMLNISPHSVRHMPCNLVTYSHEGKTIIKTRLLPTDTDNIELNQFSATINDQLRQIVDFAAEY